MPHGIKTLALVSCLLLGMFTSPGVSRGKDLIVPVDHFPPWTIIDGENITGINIDILNAMAPRLGLTVTFVQCPWKRCLAKMKQGRADLITSLLRRPERETYMVYITPPYKTRSAKAFYLRKGDTRPLLKYEDLYGLVVGVERGTKYFTPFDDDPDIRRHIVTHGALQLHKLLLGKRIDVFIDTASSMDYQLKTDPELTRQIMKAPYTYDYHTPVFMALSKKSKFADQLPRFNAVMADLVSRGIVDGIIRDFLAF